MENTFLKQQTKETEEKLDTKLCLQIVELMGEKTTGLAESIMFLLHMHCSLQYIDWLYTKLNCTPSEDRRKRLLEALWGIRCSFGIKKFFRRRVKKSLHVNSLKLSSSTNEKHFFDCLPWVTNRNIDFIEESGWQYSAYSSAISKVQFELASIAKAFCDPRSLPLTSTSGYIKYGKEATDRSYHPEQLLQVLSQKTLKNSSSRRSNWKTNIEQFFYEEYKFSYEGGLFLSLLQGLEDTRLHFLHNPQKMIETLENDLNPTSFGAFGVFIEERGFKRHAREKINRKRKIVF